MANKIMNIIFAIIEIVSRPYKRLGRIGRAEYINLSSLYTLIYIIIFAILTIVFDLNLDSAILIGLMGIFYYFFILKIWVRRLHDINLNGYWGLLSLLPWIFIISGSSSLILAGNIINLLFALILFFLPGTKGENLYGDQPTYPSEYKILTAVFLTFLCIMFYGTNASYLLEPEGSTIKKLLNAIKRY